MVTAWSPSGSLRARTSAGPLRLLWPIAMLLTLAFTHGANADCAGTHSTAVAGVPVHASAAAWAGHAAGAGDGDEAAHSRGAGAAGGHHEGETAPHAAEGCVAGQPQQGPDVAAPCATGLDWASPTQGHPPGGSGFRSESMTPPSRDPRDSVVQQV